MYRCCFGFGLTMTLICILSLSLNPKDFLIPGIILLVISILWTAGSARFLWCYTPPKQPLLNLHPMPPPQNYITISMEQEYIRQQQQRSLMDNIEHNRQKLHQINMERYQNTFK